MTRNDIIAAINDMFDENTELKTKNKYLADKYKQIAI